MNSTLSKSVQMKGFHSIFSGLIYSFISMGILTMLVSVFLLLSSLKEDSLNFYIFLIHGLSLIIGGFITGKRIGNKGWYYGGLMGISYSIIIHLVGFLGFDSTFNLNSLILLILSFVTGALGGAIGVNSKK